MPAAWTPLLGELPNDVRLLAFNQRAYAGSSPALELEEEGGTDATAAYLCDVGEFVRFAAEELGVPPVGAGGAGGGGVVLLVSGPARPEPGARARLLYLPPALR